MCRLVSVEASQLSTDRELATALPNIKHCGRNLDPFKVYYLKPLSSRPDVNWQIAYEFNCPGCNNVVYRWCSLFDNGRHSELHRIRPDDWRNDWLQRIEREQEERKKKEVEMRAQIHVSEFTKKIAKPPDEAIQYLKKSAS